MGPPIELSQGQKSVVCVAFLASASSALERTIKVKHVRMMQKADERFVKHRCKLLAQRNSQAAVLPNQPEELS